MMTTLRRLCAVAFCLLTLLGALPVRSALTAMLPDGRTVTPAGFTLPVEGFAAAQALSPDRRFLAVLAQDGGAVDIIALDRSILVDRLALGTPGGVTWTADGLYVTRGYSGAIARYAYTPPSGRRAAGSGLVPRSELQAGPGLLSGVAEDPATHRLAVARTAAREVVVLDDRDGSVLARNPASGQPYAVAFAAGTLFATLYDSDHVDAWTAAGAGARIATGPHPTQMLAANDAVYVADADGHDVVRIDATAQRVTRRFDLATGPNAPPGQTPAGMALSDDGAQLFVAESGFNDVAVVDTATGAVRARIPTGWYPTGVSFVARTVSEKDPRPRAQLWIASAKGFGSQPDPGSEWDGTYTGLVQHVVVEPGRFGEWSRSVARNDRWNAAVTARADLPPVKHVVFIVRENKHFDEEFGDEPRANADPALLLYGRTYTPNAHRLAENYTLFDNFMTNGEASIYGHAWTTQAMVNDYHERNAHLRDDGTAGVDARVATSIWPYALGGEDTVTPAQMDFDWFTNLANLPGGPRINVSGVFGPRGELVDELARKHVSFRVYGEQLTMQPDGRIAPELAEHADRAYPGAHIDFGVLDSERAKLFLDDVHAHGLAAYSYLTLPTDHTAGTKAGFYTPASYVASNDAALGTIVAGLSRRPEWRDTVVFVTCDDAQGTGDHADSHRMPAFAIGPYVRRTFVSHTHYSQTSILRTVELLFGLDPLNVYDAAAVPIVDAFARQPVSAPYAALAALVPMEKNPGKAVSLVLPIDGPESAAIPDQEWSSLRGTHVARLARHDDDM